MTKPTKDNLKSISRIIDAVSSIMRLFVSMAVLVKILLGLFKAF